jgi:hypothetical protein
MSEPKIGDKVRVKSNGKIGIIKDIISPPLGNTTNYVINYTEQVVRKFEPNDPNPSDVIQTNTLLPRRDFEKIGGKRRRKTKGRNKNGKKRRYTRKH